MGDRGVRNAASFYLDSTAPGEISVSAATADTVAMASLSNGGTCFWIKDVTSAGGGTTYGTGTPATCSGTDALGAAGTSW